jgi:putative membrane protein
MNRLGRVGLLLGVALLIFLGGKLGQDHLLAALAGSALPVACASVYHLVPLMLYTESWRALLPPAPRPPFLRLLWLRWMGEAINALLPVGQVGGDVVRALRLVRTGVPAPDAGASMIGDVMTGFSSQLVFTLVGLLALVWRARGDEAGRLSTSRLAGIVAIVAFAALIVLSVAVVALVRFGVSRIAARLPLWPALTARWKGLAGGAARLDAALRALLARRVHLGTAFAWHLAGWFSQAGETWLVLALMGHPISWSAALIIESLAATARAAVFFVPGGLGVQEATVVGIGQCVGLSVESAVALGVVKRLRELVTGLPGLALWLYTGSRRRRSTAPAPEMVAER